MKKILFVADFYRQELLGGAESNDANLIKHLSTRCELVCRKSRNLTEKDIKMADFILVSNFIEIPEELKSNIKESRPYVIYEHDHKYVKTRDPSVFINSLAPRDMIINEDFYIKAKSVVVLSKICKEILEKNIPSANVYNIGCSLWSADTFDYLQELSTREKTEDLCIMKSSNPWKNYNKALEYCAHNNIIPVELQSSDYRKFLKQMSSCKRFLFLPGLLETFSRVSAEAKMMGLSLLTTPKKLGFCSEEIHTLSGIELISQLRKRNERALVKFEELLEL
jgi:hypothetical protein|tara:strand:- start:814 stop:1653 length:840 start_codon:yes stop_codon:yes gene_type:complete